MSKNILDVYKEKHGQFIIVISGLALTGKKKLGHAIERDFHIKYIDMKEYLKDVKETIQLPNGKTVISIESDNAVDWDKLNKAVNDNKVNGVVVVGLAFPTDKITFTADYHVHLKMPKQVLKTKREEYIKKHPDKKYDLETEILRINIISYPYYVDVLNRMKIDKYINVAESKPDDIYNSVYDLIVKFIWEHIPPPQKEKKEEPKTERDESLEFSDDDISSENSSLSLSEMEKLQHEQSESNYVAGVF
jgi:hypothetical protein